MDLSPDTRDIAAHFGRPVDDLRRLLAFHGLRSGAPEHVAAFARKLEDSKPFRTDLTALLRSTRDLEHGRLTSDRMLAIVAVAIGGEALLADPAASPATTHTITLVLMLLAGISGWSDTGSRASVDPARTSVPPAAPPDLSLPLKPRFAAAAQTPPPETGAADVRGFVRSDARSEARAELHSDLWPDTRTEIPPDVPTAAPPQPQTGARPEAPHVLRREPMSEIVRPSTPQAAAPDPLQRPPSAPESIAASSQTISDPTFARFPLGRTAVVQRQSSPEQQLQPEPQIRPAAHLSPEPYPPSVSQPRPAAAFSRPLAGTQSTPVTSWRSPAHATPATTSASTPPAAPVAEPENPSSGLADRDTDQTGPSPAHRQHPTSRKPTLNAILATAAVGLLAFGIFEGVHSRTAATAHTPTQTASTATPATTPHTAPSTASLTDPSAPTSRPAPPTTAPATTSDATTPDATTPDATHKHVIPPTHTPAAQDHPPATPSASHTPSAAARPRSDAPATLTRTAGFRPADLQPPPHGALAVPESTMNGHLLATRKPVYPPSALAGSIGGTVVLRAFISSDGTIRRTDVLSGPPPLVNSALAAASWRRYRPFLVGGHPVEVQTEITYHYVAP